MKKLLLLAIVVLGISAVSFGQSSITASTTATLVTPISITKGEDMNFGTVAASNTAGTVELGYNNNVTGKNGASVIISTAAKTAIFNVTGAAGENISVSVPSSPITLSGTGLTAGVTVGTFEAECGATPKLSGNIGDAAAGTLEVKVKAVLSLPANAVAGVYSNTSGLSVTVNYN